MTVFRHELRQGRTAFWIWTGAVGAMLAICVFLYPEMMGQMDAMGELFSSMGSFTAAFGMDRLNFGTLIGFYAIECGNMLGLGCAFYAAITAAQILSKEQARQTADFLFSHPIRRARVLTEKLLAVVAQVMAMNLILLALSLLSILVIGEPIPWKELLLLHLAYYLLQLELVGICFGISAFLRRGSVAVGLGIAVLFYFLNLISNLTDAASFLKNLTPYGYCDGAEIVTDGALNGGRLAIGAAFCACGLVAAWLHYRKKDL